MVHNFNWHFNTNILFGSGMEEQAAPQCAAYGSKVLLVHGGGFAEKSGLLDKLRASFSSQSLTVRELSGIVPNPVVGKVREGIALFREMKADVILAVGGGSVVDTAKAIAAGAHYEGDVWDLFLGKGQVTSPPPVGVVLTIAAAGSEGSTGCVITNPETHEKYDVLNPQLRPAFAILNPELTLSLPPFETACGAVDIFAHAMERYFTDTKEVELTDRLGEAVMKTALGNGAILAKDPGNLTARSQIMWAGTLAHNGLLEGGRNGDWASHAIGTELSAYYNTAHGATLSVIIPAWMKYVYRDDLSRFARFANAVMEVEYVYDDLELTARRGIERLEAQFRQMGMPTTLREIGVTDDSLVAAMSKAATRFGSAGCMKKLTAGDVAEIYKLAH